MTAEGAQIPGKKGLGSTLLNRVAEMARPHAEHLADKAVLVGSAKVDQARTNLTNMAEEHGIPDRIRQAREVIQDIHHFVGDVRDAFDTVRHAPEAARKAVNDRVGDMTETLSTEPGCSAFLSRIVRPVSGRIDETITRVEKKAGTVWEKVSQDRIDAALDKYDRIEDEGLSALSSTEMAFDAALTGLHHPKLMERAGGPTDRDMMTLGDMAEVITGEQRVQGEEAIGDLRGQLDTLFPGQSQAAQRELAGHVLDLWQLGGGEAVAAGVADRGTPERQHAADVAYAVMTGGMRAEVTRRVTQKSPSGTGARLIHAAEYFQFGGKQDSFDPRSVAVRLLQAATPGSVTERMPKAPRW